MIERALLLMALSAGVLSGAALPAADDLEAEFANPPDAAKPWVYWWWLHGAASKEAITKDLEEMKRQGISGVLVFNSGRGGRDAPKGTAFMSPQWRELCQYAVREAARLGIEVGVNLCSGWNTGGTWVTPEHAVKKLIWSQTRVQGGSRTSQTLPQPAWRDGIVDGGERGRMPGPSTVAWPEGFYREIALLAYPVSEPSAVIDHRRVLDLTRHMDAEGRLTWDAPPGSWELLRFGYTLLGLKTDAAPPGEQGYEIDFLDARAMDFHFEHTGQKLLEDAGDLAGRTLKYFHIDSHEGGSPSWTPSFREEFLKRRGYDPLPFLPVMARKTVDSPEVSERFRWDVRRTVADLFAANYYGRLRELARRHGAGMFSEAGEPPNYDVDGLQCAGINDIPMGEFWKRNVEPVSRARPVTYGLRQAAAAAHIYGKELCQAEAFTSLADDWTDDPWSMKDIGDAAFCNGLTRNVLCFYVHQPRLDIKPGYEMPHIGTHFDRNITWWNMSHGWLQYLARCQYLLRQGTFVAEFAYFYGEQGRNFVPLTKEAFEPSLPQGFDADVLNAEVLLEGAQAVDGCLALKSGMRYRYLVLMPDRTAAVSPAVLRKFLSLVETGVTLIGSRPQRAPGLTDYPKCDEDVQTLDTALWGQSPAASAIRRVGSGRVIWGRTLDEVLRQDALHPDVEFDGAPADEGLRAIHRRGDRFDAYFVANMRRETVRATCRFRVVGRQPELWDAVSGQIRELPEFQVEGDRTEVPMVFAPRQSFFVVFRQKASGVGVRGSGKNFPEAKVVGELAEPWEVSFDPKWGGPEHVRFERLTDWTQRPEEGVKYYSGTATYRKVFDLPSSLAPRPSSLYLHLGAVKNLAAVRLNGKSLGVVWTAPWQVDITEAVTAKGNLLEIDVANLWPNRLIGDGRLPPEKRLTVTNVKTYESVLPPVREYPTYGCQTCQQRRATGEPRELLPSGLLGPVTMQAAER